MLNHPRLLRPSLSMLLLLAMSIAHSAGVPMPVAGTLTGAMAATQAAIAAPPSRTSARELLANWQWPTVPARIAAAFVAPAHEYGPGHRGIDLVAAIGDEVHAPADGVIAFAGSVAGRGILTIDHDEGLVTTLEPVQTTLRSGTPVRAGDVVGFVDAGGHAAPGTVHFGVREEGVYINPLLLLGGVEPAILLPCC